MPKIKILSDSTCDLSAELVEKYEIGLIPLYINLGGRVLPDGVSVSPDDIYAYVEKTGELPGTIASSIEDFRKAFQTYRDQGYEVICHTISSDMSCSFQNARIAAQEVDGVYVVDSRNLSSGVGHVVINAAIMARQAVLAKGKDPVGTDGDAQAAAAALCPVDGNGGATIHITPFPLEKNPYPR